MEVQREGAIRYATRLSDNVPGLSLTTDKFEDESISSFSVPFRERPAGKRLLETVQPGDKIVIYRLDRGFRDELDGLQTVRELLDRGVAVHLASEGVSSDSEFGMTWFTLMVSFAALESKIKRNRSLDVKQHLESQGRPSGTVPKGFRTEVNDGKRKLAYDLDDISERMKSWICMNLGLTDKETSSLLIALRAQNNRLRPRTPEWSANYAEGRKSAPRVHKFECNKMLKSLPRQVMLDGAERAILELREEVVAPYKPIICKRDLHQELSSMEPRRVAEVLIGE